MQDNKKQKTILIVDDVSANIDLLADVLNRDYKVKAALNDSPAKIAPLENSPLENSPLIYRLPS